jgi:hypothetical protein
MNYTKYLCRTCLEQKNDLISLFSINSETGLQFFDMVLQVSMVQVRYLFKEEKFTNFKYFKYFLFFRFVITRKRMLL